MNWFFHIIFSLILVFLISYFFPVSLPFYIIAGFSALMPDIDLVQSKGRRILDVMIIIFVFSIFFIRSFSFSSLIFSLAILGFYFLMFTIFKPKHRGITHSFLALFLYSIFFYFFFGFNLAFVAFIGYLSHLIGDLTFKLA